MEQPRMKGIIKLLCICASLIIGISVVLPYFSVSGLGVTVSKSLMDGRDGIFVIIVAAIALIFSIFGKYAITVFLGMASFGLFFLENNTVTTNLGKEIDALARSMIQKNLGYYCLLIGSIALIVFSVIGLITKKSK